MTAFSSFVCTTICTVCQDGPAAVDSQRTDLHEKVGRRENAQTDGEKDPALHAAPRALVLHQLFTDLAVNFISAEEKNSGNNQKIPENKNHHYHWSHEQ